MWPLVGGHLEIGSRAKVSRGPGFLGRVVESACHATGWAMSYASGDMIWGARHQHAAATSRYGGKIGKTGHASFLGTRTFWSLVYVGCEERWHGMT